MGGDSRTENACHSPHLHTTYYCTHCSYTLHSHCTAHTAHAALCTACCHTAATCTALPLCTARLTACTACLLLHCTSFLFYPLPLFLCLYLCLHFSHCTCCLSPLHTSLHCTALHLTLPACTAATALPASYLPPSALPRGLHTHYTHIFTFPLLHTLLTCYTHCTAHTPHQFHHHTLPPFWSPTPLPAAAAGGQPGASAPWRFVALGRRLLARCWLG